MLDYKVKIGIAPVRRIVAAGRPANSIFGIEGAIEGKNVILPYIEKHFSNEHCEFVDLGDFNNGEGLISDWDHAFPAAEIFKAAKIDALFIINMNFGEEEVAAKLAQLMGVPVLIWAPQDMYFGEGPEDYSVETYGKRLTDAQCGLFATSKLMQRMGITFSHIVNCKVESDTFKNGLEDFIAVTCMLKNWKKMRILQLGNRPKPFTSMIFNESELLEKFGVEVFPLTTSNAMVRLKDILANRGAEIAEIIKYVRATYRDDVGTPDEYLKKVAALAILYRDLFKETNCSFISGECAFARAELGISACLAMSIVNSEKKYVSCESDMLGGITMCLLSCATLGEEYPFFGEFTARHPSNPNAELIWHCGPFAYQVGDPTLHEPFLHTDFAMKGSIRAGFEVARGLYSIARLDALGGEYSMIMGTFKGVEGPFTRGNYVWGEFSDWPKWEQATIFGPYVHHMAEIKGDVVRRLKEFCRYTGIRVDAPDDK
jgi:L-fucose isomerase-like protein